jgi:uncharacterized membrane protein (UPF0127 family)
VTDGRLAARNAHRGRGASDCGGKEISDAENDGMRNDPIRLKDADTNRVVIQNVAVADSLWEQAIGLIGRKRIDPGFALCLRTNGIHTFFMRFAIDVLFLDEDGTALRVVPGLRPWRIAGPVRRARTVVEAPSGLLAAQGVEVGKRYVLSKAIPKGPA